MAGKGVELLFLYVARTAALCAPPRRCALWAAAFGVHLQDTCSNAVLHFCGRPHPAVANRSNRAVQHVYVHAYMNCNGIQLVASSWWHTDDSDMLTEATCVWLAVV
eukprot:GHRQ01017399.1.p3 GENE.GHRQ01017399.1~~GHRQ01017399.1.p3  ORF type:complete len:106 (-),score=9.87 GHRQ01017399.1:148-465(-)